MFKLNMRVLLAVSVSLFVLYSLVNVASAEQARSLRLKPRLRPSSRSLRSTLEDLTDPSKRQGVVCQNFYCTDGENVYECPAGCNNCQTILLLVDPYYEVSVCAP